MINTSPVHLGWPGECSSLSECSSVRARSPQICIPIFSSFARHAYRTGMREAVDVLASCANVRLLDLQPDSGHHWKTEWIARLSYHDPFRVFARINPGLKPARIDMECDVFVAVCPFWRDLLYINAIDDWQKRSKVRVCWIDELWAKDICQMQRWLHVFDQFDHIVVGIDGTGEALGKVLGRPCHVLPGAVDSLRFSPMPLPPPRVIDLCSIGRRIDALHQAALQLARARNLFYIHDTLQTGDNPAADYRAHRDMYANIVKRSRLFFTAPGKVNLSAHTAIQADIGFRYFEGIAGGAILVGQAPNSELFRRLFHWPDSIIQLKADGSDMEEVISDLFADVDRMRQISRLNMAASLRQHDWLHRWQTIFNIAGLPLTAGMQSREKTLTTVAESLPA